MQMTNFDATAIPPVQSGGKHPEYQGAATITGTHAASTGGDEKSGQPPTGGRFVVTFTTPVGTIQKGYNLWNPSEKASEIAQKELSALCHAVGIFKLSMSPENLSMCGHELRGAQCVIDVKPQVNNPDYMEVKKVYDRNGNEPGKAPAAAPQPQGQGGGWGGGNGQAPAQQQATTVAPASTGWSAGPTVTPAAPAQQAQPQGGGNPPWAK